MLQPKETFLLLAAFFILVDSLTGLEQINTSPRKRRQDGQDVTTVLLVDNHGRPSYGRFLNVKPDVGIITSTARTFVQEGVTTEYATQVVGTTLDDGRLYAHLLTKTSRVIYDGQSKPHGMDAKKISIDQGQINTRFFVKNTDYISPNQVDTYLVFPTTDPSQYQSQTQQALAEDEILKESPSNNIRVSSEKDRQHKLVFPQNNNIKIFKINPRGKDERDNVILHEDDHLFQPSKVKEWDNIPTFTVRNEFSPSGFSYLGDLPEFDDRTERNRPTTAYERRAKNLFLAGLLKPSPKELKTTTYTGFADFTTTVGDTVIIFTPHTSEVPKIQKPVTKITVEPTIRPTVSFILPPPELKTITPSLETETETESSPPTTEESVDDESRKYLASIVMDKSNRQQYGKSQNIEHPDIEAKSAVLAHEQQGDLISTTIGKSTFIANSDVIEPSESQTPMLSTPSHEDIAKIFASLQAQANKETEPLSTPSTIFFDTEPSVQMKDELKSSGGATTIFFEDDLPIDNTATQTFFSSATTELDFTTNSATESTSESQHETIPNKPLTSTEKQTTTTEQITTTEEERQSSTYSNEQTTTDETSDTLTTNEITTENAVEDICKEGTQIVPSTIYKTLTYLTTFFIPVGDTTTTSINANEVVSTEIKLETQACDSQDISPTNTISENIEATILTTTPRETTTTFEAPEQTTTEEVQTTEQQTTTEQETEIPTSTQPLETTPQEITTERRHVTESEPETTEGTTEDGEEIELLFKTLYTTYTYLTTYFQDTTSSIASRIVVTTNVITSTLDPGSQASEDAVAGIFDRDSDLVSSYKSRPASFEDFAEITPSQIDSNISPSDIDSLDDSEEDVAATPSLSKEDIAATAVGIKTYYTTYTYFTTIFVDGETEVSSRTEVYTNYVTPTIKPTSTYGSITRTSRVDEDEDEFEDEDEDDSKEKEFKKNLHLQINPSNKYNSTISRNKSATLTFDSSDETTEESRDFTTTTSKGDYVTLRRFTTEDVPIEDNLLNRDDYESVSTMVRSTTSDGERRLLNNVDKRNILDDQIVSESNNDSEIIPSPTLLLQTSYTTFTYFTTMYQGTTGSNVVSRLETVTNVVTETLTPSHTLSVDDLSLPITYFTTFTYWTTLYKQGTTKVTSREETVSNVITPTASLSAIPETSSIEITPTTTSSSSLSTVTPTVSIEPTAVDNDYLTTVYTTYTYYTTSYVGDETVINSRLETATSVLNKTKDIESNQIARTLGSPEPKNQTEENTEIKSTEASSLKPTGLLSTIINTEENSGTTTILSTDVFGTYIDGLYAKILESTSSVLTKNITPSTVVENLKPTGVVSINQGQIVDADEISTLYYTTQAVGTYIDNLYAQVIESTSSLKIDEEKKAALETEPPAKRTGLVRLVQGSIVQNKTTTLYQSKVIGTIIDGRYAQVIESTSSFLVEKPSVSPTSSSNISPTSTLAPSDEIKPTSVTISPSSAVIEGSISDSSKPESDVKEDDNTSSTKSRLSFQPKKKTFTPGLRPFVQRPKSSYSPKRRLPGATSATTVTRNDFTPTVTAIPASKGKFGNRRNNGSIQPTASGSRKFSRSKTSSFNGRRGSSRIQPTSTGFGSSSRRGFRSSSPGAIVKSSGLFSNSARFRIRPTASSSLIKSPSSAAVTEQSENDEENNATTQVTDELDENDHDTTIQASTTTESSRRQNPLLRLRRPPLGRPPIGGTRSTTPRSARTNTANNKANNRASSTTTKPKTTRGSPLNRARPNALFPRRNLFTTSTTQAPIEDEEGDEENEDLIEENEDGEDNDYEGSQKQPQTAKPPPSSKPGSIRIKPFNFGKRSKRDTYSRFRRPTSKTTPSPIEDDYLDYEEPKPKPKPNRYTSRARSSKSFQASTQSAPTTPRKRISPNKVKPQARTQFTLRPEKEKSNFRRPSSSRPRSTTVSPRSRPRNSYNNHQTESTNHRKSSGRANSRPASNRRGSSRQRIQSQEINDNYILPGFDGTITVTHQIPTEVTIPVINGKITEYKNIVTAKLSTEVLEPAQYSTSLNPFGKEVTVLLNELTTLANNGATLITQFVLNETPTTSIIFTPTYIRNRKTSFSHIVPSTIYAVEPVVNTIQPALAAQAPLANILLSQLLLGGLQPQNPLLALQNPGATPTPTTEFKTRTTTYVTTITSSTSTVIPLTFRGKEILTTIVDSKVNVITATEFLTDTVIVTPTLAFPVAGQQLNTLLLPLLQQQLAQPAPQIVPKLAGFSPLTEDPLLHAAHLDEPETFNLALDDVSEESIIETKPKVSKANKKPKKPTPVEPAKETSVITLYVSGKTPGEFSTVLSTVISDPKERRRRDSGEEVKPSKILDDLIISTLDYLDTYVLPGRREEVNFSPEVNSETESLESILGDVNKHIKSTSKHNSILNPTDIRDSTKKFKINVVDLFEKAPLKPKVETSRNFRGDTLQKSLKIHVSKTKGNKNLFRNDLETIIRNKRDLTSYDNSTKPKPVRIRKKLIRIEPIYNNSLKNSDAEKVENNVKNITRHRMRRKLKIKKKKRKLNRVSKPVISGDFPQNPSSSSKGRKKLVVTRKRLIKAPTIIANTVNPDEAAPKTILANFFEASSRPTPELEDNDTTLEDDSTEGKDTTLEDDSTEGKDTLEDDSTEENDTTLEDYSTEENDTTEDDNPILEEDEEYSSDEYDDIDEEGSEEEGNEEYVEDENHIQHVPDYEPSFPELSETFEAPVLLLKTTVLSSVELETKTIVESRIRTYTFLITRVSGTEQIVTSTTELKPHVKTTTVTNSLTKLTTLTLLDFEPTPTTSQMTITSFSGSLQHLNEPKEEEEHHFDEARNYLATRVMSNGVEVIVAGDKSTLPGEPDVKRVLPSTIFKPVTLRPSTLSEHMMMLMPSDASKINSITSSLYPNNKFVTKTCLTTFTYLTTYLESGTTTVSSHEQVVSNIATEERNTGKILPTPSMGITLTQYPSLSVGVFYTTYTYLNTIVDGDQPLVITSKHTVTNTVTAPDDYLSLIQNSDKVVPQKDTNTYYSTIMLTKTVKDGDKTKILSTKEKLTQIVITESVPPKATSVMTSYIALDVEDPGPDVSLTTTDVVKTYFVTYTYYNTLVENGKTIIHTNVSTAADVTTEKIYLHPKRNGQNVNGNHKEISPENVVIIATKTYQTTFTYFTTLLQEDNSATPTVVSSHSKVVENIATETIHPKQLNENYWKMLESELKNAQGKIKETVVLNDGQKLEVTAYKKTITPTKVLPIETTTVPKQQISDNFHLESSNPNVITGSTIIFFDDEPSSSTKPTPSLKKKSTQKNTATINSAVIKKTQVLTSSSKIKKSKIQNVKPTKTSSVPRPSKYKAESTKKKQVAKLPKPSVAENVGGGGDLLGLGSINMESLKALTPVINAMAGLIQTNLKSNRKEKVNETSVKPPVIHKNNIPLFANDTQNRSPIYIPVGDLEVSESQNIASYQYQNVVDWEGNKVDLKKPHHESPLLNGGIPISPGEVITANSDVIVGKPGRILPRVPAIPLSPNHVTEISDLNPPPPVFNNWSKTPNRNPIPVGAQTEPLPAVVHAPNKDDYVGPPPPPSNKLYTRDEKHKHIPIHNNEDHKGYRRPERPYAHMHIPLNQNYAHRENNYGINYQENEIRKPTQPLNLQIEIQKKYEHVSKDNVPIYAQGHASPAIHYASHPKDFNIRPSIIREPMVLPEVIERSTGQPLLVNIQPSQVAFVNIPHNRTTALIYGGSTEPHRNGQYFDDPSPYSEPEYPINENFNNIAHYTHDYNSHSNQKQVNGVIRVGGQPIRVQPDSSNSRIEHISPSKPQDLFVNANNQEINVQVPPISFGMFQNGNDFNAHIINHGNPGEGIQFQLPPVAFEIVKSQNKNAGQNQHQEHQHNYNYNKQNNKNSVQNQHQEHQHNNNYNKQNNKNAAQNQHQEHQHNNNYSVQNNNHQENMQNNQNSYNNKAHKNKPASIYHNQQYNHQESHRKKNQSNYFSHEGTRNNSDYSLNPPRYQLKYPQNPQFSRRPDNPKKDNQILSNDDNYHLISKPKLPSATLADYMIPPNYKPKQTTPTQFHSKPTNRPQNQVFPINQGQKFQPGYQTISNKYNLDHTFVPNIKDQGNDVIDDYDLVNSDGEVIQESNSRPLRPGEVPHEILKLTTSRTPMRRNSTIVPTDNKFKLPYENEVHQFKAPVIADPRPFVRPENYQTNQIIKFDHSANGITFNSNSFDKNSIKDLLRGEVVKSVPPKSRPEEFNTFSHSFTPTSQVPSNSYEHHNNPSVPINTNGKIESVTVIPTKGNRPKVTSLPIDANTEQTKKTIVAPHRPPSTQTEEPFNRKPVGYEIDGKVVPNEKPNRDQVTATSTESIVQLNIGEIIDTNTSEASLEIMKPPTPTPYSLKKPVLTLKPPQVESISPGADIHKVPVFNDKHVNIAGSPKPFVPQPAENMMPPPRTVPNDEVLGMSPPPITTYKPKLSLRPKVSTTKPTSLQIDTPKQQVPLFEHILTTTGRSVLKIRTRRPYPPRRTFKTTIPTTKRPNTRRPNRPNYTMFNRSRTTTSPPNFNFNQPTLIIPVSTFSSTPKIEVIVGEPVKKEQVGDIIGDASDPSKHTSNIYKDSAKTNPSGFKVNTDLFNIEPSKKDIIASSVHHAGNEVKIIDETDTKLPTTLSTPELPTVKLLPTRFITHTHTSTVTITKTTVVKTPGGPPSTLTLLVTKTEKSTIVDTVTEFHTLVKPTSIIETVTTTVQTGSLYPSDVYGSTYPSIQVRPTKTVIGEIVTPTIIETINESENLDDFIITDTDPPITSNESQVSMHDNDTIFVVMTDKNHGSIIKMPPTEETQRDEMLNNKVNDILIGGILSANPNSIDTDTILLKDRCEPECKASRNELCQKTNGLMRCVCRPGFARMFPDRPCNPTYTYSLEIDIDRLGRRKLTYNDNLSNPNSSEYLLLAATTHEALDRMVMQSDLRDIYHGVSLHKFQPGKTGIVNTFYLQLSDNTDEKRLEEVFKKYLRSNNYSLGGTELYASKESQQSLRAVDFDECHNVKFHDCSDNAQCFNLKGTYTCSCKEGFSDLSENILYPGRVCSAELIGCEKCNYHGTCYSRGDDQVICECFQWYSGETCYVNLKVLLIALVSLGFILFVLLLICCIVTCCKKKPTSRINTGLSFFPQRVPHPADRSTMDRRAMIPDTSSEDSRSETNSLPYVAKPKPKRPKSALKKTSLPRRLEMNGNQNTQTLNEQKDRSLTVMIPRAKYHPAPPAPNMSSYTTFDASKATMSKPQNNETKLLSYLDAGPSPHKVENKRKYSSQVSESYIDDEPISRKTSGALVSAGFEVSATVGNNMGTLGTTCGTEADRSENATLIQKISADLLSCTGTRSQSNTLRNFEDDDLDPMSNWMEIEPRITTISEARSYDETSIPPPMKTLRRDYDTKMSVHSHSHSHHHDEVAERDLGSTFLLPHTHLYKPDRGSDISGFESL